MFKMIKYSTTLTIFIKINVQHFDILTIIPLVSLLVNICAKNQDRNKVDKIVFLIYF